MEQYDRISSYTRKSSVRAILFVVLIIGNLAVISTFLELFREVNQKNNVLTEDCSYTSRIGTLEEKVAELERELENERNRVKALAAAEGVTGAVPDKVTTVTEPEEGASTIRVLPSVLGQNIVEMPQEDSSSQLTLLKQDPQNNEKSAVLKPDVIDLARAHVEPPSNVTAAVCFKTLFGDIDLGIVLQWVAYNRLLGFDHFFFFYRPEMKARPRFDELFNLPFVTMTENTQGNKRNFYKQVHFERVCLSEAKYAKGYDWVMLADIDEYLWFSNHVGLKEFLGNNGNMTYLSFGKSMYTLDHSTDVSATNLVVGPSQNPDIFALSQYPFYIKSFCVAPGRKGHPICPTWHGRSKVIVNPKYHEHIDTHGNIRIHDLKDGKIHFHPDIAHFKEWPHIFAPHNVTKREPIEFKVSSRTDVSIHNLETGFIADEDGKFTMRYDNDLQNWFEFVMGRASTTPAVAQETS